MVPLMVLAPSRVKIPAQAGDGPESVAAIVAHAVCQLGRAAIGDIDRIGVDRALEEIGADPEVGDVDGGKLGPGDADGPLDGACAVQGQDPAQAGDGSECRRVVADAVSQLGGAAVGDIDRIGVDRALEEIGGNPEVGDVDGSKLGAGDADGPLDGACAVQGKYRQAGDGSESVAAIVADSISQLGGAAVEDMDRIGVDRALEEVGADPEFGDVDGGKLGAGTPMVPLMVLAPSRVNTPVSATLVVMPAVSPLL